MLLLLTYENHRSRLHLTKLRSLPTIRRYKSRSALGPSPIAAELPVEGVQDQEAVATQESLDLTATFERLARLDGQQRQSTNNKVP